MLLTYLFSAVESQNMDTLPTMSYRFVDSKQGPHFMVFGAKIMPQYIFFPYFPKEKHRSNKQAKLNVFCLKQDFFLQYLIKICPYDIKYVIQHQEYCF